MTGIIIKLTDGTQVFADGEQVPGDLTVQRPMVLQELGNGFGALMKLFPYSDDESFVIRSTTIVAVASMSKLAEAFHDKAWRHSEIAAKSEYDAVIQKSLDALEKAIHATEFAPKVIESVMTGNTRPIEEHAQIAILHSLEKPERVN